MLDSLCSNIVYGLTSPCCNVRYIGSTSRNLRLRTFEHNGKSFRTNNYLSQPSFSMVREHSRQQDHLFSEKDFSILYKARSLSEARIAESIFMYKSKPVLNNYDTAIKLLTLP